MTQPRLHLISFRTLILTVTLINSVMTSVFGQDPIEISTIEDLQKIGKDDTFPIDGHYVLTQNIDASTYSGFEPIAEDNEFSGVFDGRGHKVISLVVNEIHNGGGLFKKIGNTGIVRNLGLESCDMSGEYIGGLVGENHGSISRCYIQNSRINSNGFSAAGLVWANSGTVSDCYADCDVHGYDEIKGLVAEDHGGTIVNCYSVGLRSRSRDYEWNEDVPVYFEAKIWGRDSIVRTYNDSNTALEDMMHKSTFEAEGWNFEDIWTIDEGNWFPTLRFANNVSVLMHKHSVFRASNRILLQNNRSDLKVSIPEQLRNKDLCLSVYSLSGKIVLYESKMETSQLVSISTSRLAPGFYQLALTVGGENFIERFTIVR